MAPVDPPPPPASLGSKIWQSRWIVLVASFWIQACAGIGYAFGSYSPLIKTSLGYTQQQVNILGNAKDFGDSIGLLAGYLCEILPTWGLLLVGAVQNLVGYGWLWLIVTQRAAALPLWAICILMFIGTNGETYFNTAALVTNVRNFPKSRGHVVGLLKGFTGLCGAIFTQIYTTFFAPDEAAYLFIVAVGPTMVAIFVMFIIRPIRVKSADSTRSESIGFTFIYGVCLVLASYLMGVLIVQDIVTVSFSVSLTITLILLFLILLPLAAPLVSWFVRTRRPIPKKGTEAAESASVRAKRLTQINDDAEIVAPLLPEQIPAAEVGFTADDLGQDQSGLSSGPGSFTGSVGFSELEDEKLVDLDDVLPEKLKQHEHVMHKVESRKLLAAAEGAVGVSSKRRPRRGEDFTLLQALVKADFWLLFWSLLCGAASGLTAIDNMGQMSESQGYSNSNIFVSMMSIWNFLGRLVGGYGSEVLARKYALPRSWALVAAQAVMVVGHFLFAMAWPGTLYVGTLLVGIGYGSHWGIVPPIVSEIFGLKNFGMLYNVYTIANPAGSVVFSGILAGYLYDLEAAKQNAVGVVAAGLHPSSTISFFSESGSNTCYGAVCFRLTFLIMSAVCLIGMVLSVVLSIRTQIVYKSLYGKSPSEIAATRS